jgi:hypothetical protein
VTSRRIERPSHPFVATTAREPTRRGRTVAPLYAHDLDSETVKVRAHQVAVHVVLPLQAQQVQLPSVGGSIGVLASTGSDLTIEIVDADFGV